MVGNGLTLHSSVRSYLGSLVRPGVETGVVDALVAVLAHQQVLALVRLGRALITDNARLALVTDPAVLLIVMNQLSGVNPAAGVDTLTTAMARHQVLHLARRIAALSTETLRADGDHGRFLERTTIINNSTGIRLCD